MMCALLALCEALPVSDVMAHDVCGYHRLLSTISCDTVWCHPQGQRRPALESVNWSWKRILDSIPASFPGQSEII